MYVSLRVIVALLLIVAGDAYAQKQRRMTNTATATASAKIIQGVCFDVIATSSGKKTLHSRFLDSPDKSNDLETTIFVSFNAISTSKSISNTGGLHTAVSSDELFTDSAPSANAVQFHGNKGNLQFSISALAPDISENPTGTYLGRFVVTVTYD